MARLWRFWVLGLALGMACGCESGKSKVNEAPPALVEMDRELLLRPFMTEQVVLADQLIIEISPNFDGDVGRAAGGELHRGKDVDEVVWNLQSILKKWRAAEASTGARQPSLQFPIGKTLFRIDRNAKLRVLLGRPQSTFMVHAKGRVQRLDVETKKKTTCQEMLIKDGVVQYR